IDHPTRDMDESRPEGSLRDQCGWLSECRYERGADGVGCIVGNLRLSEGAAGDEALRLIKSALQYQKEHPGSPPWLGLSIDAEGPSTEAWEDGRLVHHVEGFSAIRNCALVTRPGAGGQVLELRESNSGTANGALLRKRGKETQMADYTDQDDMDESE